MTRMCEHAAAPCYSFIFLLLFKALFFHAQQKNVENEWNSALCPPVRRGYIEFGPSGVKNRVAARKATRPRNKLKALNVSCCFSCFSKSYQWILNRATSLLRSLPRRVSRCLTNVGIVRPRPWAGDLRVRCRVRVKKQTFFFFLMLLFSLSGIEH